MVKNLSVGAILAVVIVTTLIVSVATVFITGNVIKVKSTMGGTQVYTKAEVDNFIKAIVTNTKTIVELKVTANSSTSGTSSDRASFIDLRTGNTLETTWKSEGKGSLTVNGLTYDILMVGSSEVAPNQRKVTVSGNAISTQTGYVGDLFILE